MKKNEMIIENGIIAGNLYDKYGTRNPIAGYLMREFHNSLKILISMTGASEIHEIGCGEGNLCVHLAKLHKRVRGSDFSEQITAKAKYNAEKNQVDVKFKAVSIYDLTSEEDAAELILCCEVLEHLEKTHHALTMLAQLAKPYLIVSVPREPLWSILNMARGKYISRFGNTPGHVQQWSKEGFLNLISSYFEIVKVLTPVPWTMALCRLTGFRD